MDYVAVPVDPQAAAYETVPAFRRTAWDWLEHRDLGRWSVLAS